MAFTTISTFLADAGTLPTLTSANTNNAAVVRDASGNFSANTITANLSGNATTATTATNAGSFTGTLAGDVTGTQGATVVSLVGGQTAANVASATALVTGSQTANTLLAAPDGSAGAPSFRSLVLNDLASLTTGSTSGYVLTSTGSGTAPVWQATSGGITGSGATNQVAVWSAATSLTGNNNYQWNGSQLTLTAATPSQTNLQPNMKLAFGQIAANANTTYIETKSWTYANTLGSTNADGLRLYMTQANHAPLSRVDNANLYLQRGFPGTGGGNSVGGYVGFWKSGSSTTANDKNGLALGYSTSELTNAPPTPALFIDSSQAVNTNFSLNTQAINANGLISATAGVDATSSYVRTTDLVTSGTFAVNAYNMTGNYTVDSAQPDTHLAAVTNVTGSITVSLPQLNTLTPGRFLSIANTATTGSNTITVTPFAGDTLANGLTSVVLTPGQAITLTGDQGQTNWSITGSYGMSTSPAPTGPTIVTSTAGTVTVTEAQTGDYFQSSGAGTVVYALPALTGHNVDYDILNDDTGTTTQLSIPSGMTLRVPGAPAVAGPTTYSTSTAFAAIKVIGNLSALTYTVLEQTAAWTNP